MANYRFIAGNKTAELFLYDVIGGWGGVTAKQVAADLKAAGKIDTLNVRINSPGGDVFEGYAIYNQLVRQAATVEVDVDGMALSIASIIALAGETVRMAKNAMYMIHDPMGMAFGTAAELRKTAAVLDQVHGQLVDTYVAKTGKTRDDVVALMAAETWMTAPEAAQAGFVDEVTADLALAASADLGQFRHVPAWAQRLATRAPTPKLDLRRASLARL